MTRARELADQHKTLDVDGGTIKLDGNYPVGTGNVALGDAALDDGSLSGNQNTAVGSSALSANTTASNNTAVGWSAGLNITSGTANTAVGRATMSNTTTGSYNTVLGMDALQTNTTGSNNTAIGYLSLLNNTTASENTAVGYQAGYANTTGTPNAAFGYRSQYLNTTGNYNSSFGAASLRTNTTGSNNVSFGYAALYSNTTASNSTAVGYQAGYYSTGQRNAFFGSEAGQSNTTGESNTYLGRQAGQLMTTGNNNTIIGRYGGNANGLDIRTSSNNVVLSDGDGFPLIRIAGGASTNDIHRYYAGVGQPRLDFSATNFGYSGGYTVLMLGQTSGNHSVSIGYDPVGNTTGGFSGNGSETLFRRGMKFLTPNSADTAFYTQFTMTDGVTSGDFNDTSDVALKENIQTIPSAWDTVSQLRPVTFDWKQEGRGTRSGFIAQEVEVLLPNDVIGDDYAAPDAENGIEGNGGKAINTTGIVAHLTKALQEAMDRIETLEAKVQALETN